MLKILRKCQLRIKIKSQNLIFLNSVKNLHYESGNKGLEEFFDKDLNENERKGLAWTKELLKLKSNVELHKLW